MRKLDEEVIDIGREFQITVEKTCKVIKAQHMDEKSRGKNLSVTHKCNTELQSSCLRNLSVDCWQSVSLWSWEGSSGEGWDGAGCSLDRFRISRHLNDHEKD